MGMQFDTLLESSDMESRTSIIDVEAYYNMAVIPDPDFDFILCDSLGLIAGDYKSPCESGKTGITIHRKFVSDK
jgi:hypothetical protein